MRAGGGGTRCRIVSRGGTRRCACALARRRAPGAAEPQAVKGAGRGGPGRGPVPPPWGPGAGPALPCRPPLSTQLPRPLCSSLACLAMCGCPWASKCMPHLGCACSPQRHGGAGCPLPALLLHVWVDAGGLTWCVTGRPGPGVPSWHPRELCRGGAALPLRWAWLPSGFCSCAESGPRCHALVKWHCGKCPEDDRHRASCRSALGKVDLGTVSGEKRRVPACRIGCSSCGSGMIHKGAVLCPCGNLAHVAVG